MNDRAAGVWSPPGASGQQSPEPPADSSITASAHPPAPCMRILPMSPRRPSSSAPCRPLGAVGVATLTNLGLSHGISGGYPYK